MHIKTSKYLSSMFEVRNYMLLDIALLDALQPMISFSIFIARYDSFHLDRGLWRPQEYASQQLYQAASNWQDRLSLYKSQNECALSVQVIITQ